MDIKVSKALSSFKLYSEYSREEVHQAFDDGTRYVTGGGIWGRSGVIKPKLKDDIFVLFCLIKPLSSSMRIQYIEPNGKFHWLSQPSMYPGGKKLNNIISVAKEDSKVLLFAKPIAGPKYAYLGRLSYVTTDDKLLKPTIVTWKITPWPMPPEIKNKFGVK